MATENKLFTELVQSHGHMKRNSRHSWFTTMATEKKFSTELVQNYGHRKEILAHSSLLPWGKQNVYEGR